MRPGYDSRDDTPDSYCPSVSRSLSPDLNGLLSFGTHLPRDMMFDRKKDDG